MKKLKEYSVTQQQNELASPNRKVVQHIFMQHFIFFTTFIVVKKLFVQNYDIKDSHKKRDQAYLTRRRKEF
jgi:hypothetical protein